MPEITVPKDQRPSYLKYVAYTVMGILVVNGMVGTLAGSADAPVIALGAVSVAGVLNVAIVFLMVQSLVEEWFVAAEIVEE